MNTKIEAAPRTGLLPWGLRSYGWVVALSLILAFVLAGAISLLRPVTYQASALVVAQQVEMSEQALPRFAEAVFNGGTLAQQVAADPRIGGDPNALIPERLSLDAPADSVVLRVSGSAETAERAALIADVGAAEFVIQLNRPGAGVGVFALQEPARAPTDPLDGPSPVVVLGVASIAGLVFGFGLVVLVLIVRRPIIDPADVEEVLVIPVLGQVILPRRCRSGEFYGPRGIPGIGLVGRAVAGSPHEVMHVVAAPGLQRIREMLVVMLALTIGRTMPVKMLAAARVRSALDTALRRDNSSDAPIAGFVAPTSVTTLTLIDAADPLDTLATTGASTAVILVIPRGIPRRRLMTIAAEYLPEELYGVVMVGSRRLPRSTLDHIVDGDSDEAAHSTAKRPAGSPMDIDAAPRRSPTSGTSRTTTVSE